MRDLERLRDGGLTDGQIVDALHATLTDSHSTGEYPIGGDAVFAAEYKTAPGGEFPANRALADTG